MPPKSSEDFVLFSCEENRRAGPEFLAGIRTFSAPENVLPQPAAINSDCFTITSACLIEAMSTSRPL